MSISLFDCLNGPQGLTRGEGTYAWIMTALPPSFVAFPQPPSGERFSTALQILNPPTSLSLSAKTSPTPPVLALHKARNSPLRPSTAS